MRGLPRDVVRLDEFEGDLRVGLGTSVSGLEFVDTDLELDSETKVDHVALDPRGRLVLVTQVAGDEDATALLAFDVLTFARRNLSLLSRHFAKGPLRSDLGPLLVLVAEHFTDRLLARLELLGEAVRLFELREIRTNGAQGTYLVPVGSTEGDREGVPAGPVDFVTTLPDDVRELGYLAIRRISRIDPQLECRPKADGLVWRYRGLEICRLDRSPDGITAAIAGGGLRFAVRTPRDVETLVDEALAYQIERSRQETEGELDAAGDYDEIEEHEEFDDLEPRALVPGAGPILTREEIEAFRE